MEIFLKLVSRQDANFKNCIIILAMTSIEYDILFFSSLLKLLYNFLGYLLSYQAIAFQRLLHFCSRWKTF